MKLVLITWLIFLPISLLSQKEKKFEVADSVIDVTKILNETFGKEIMKQLGEPSSIHPYSFGILELDNILEENTSKDLEKMPGGCQCHLINGKIEISNAVGFMAGIASVVEINLMDSTYQSKIYYHTDNMKTHKFIPGDEFIEDIQVVLEESMLEISPDSKFEHNGIIRGKLVGKSIKYYEQDYSTKGYSEVQTKVLSIFECSLQDYGQMMLDMKEHKEKEDKN